MDQTTAQNIIMTMLTGAVTVVAWLLRTLIDSVQKLNTQMAVSIEKQSHLESWKKDVASWKDVMSIIVKSLEVRVGFLERTNVKEDDDYGGRY